MFQFKSLVVVCVVACLNQQQALAKTLVFNQVLSSTSSPSESTTYDWGKHTGSTYDWGKHTPTTGHPDQSTTYDWGKHTQTTGHPDQSTTYDWGKHTGSTYDWGKHTPTTGHPDQSTTYDWGKHTQTTGHPDQSTTYDWGKHTGSTYDWGKHTKTTEHPGQSTTYDWGKHTQTTGHPDQSTTYDWGKHTGSTYDWGKHTSTHSPNDNTTTPSPDDQHNGTDYRCGAGKYSCAGTVGMCIDLKKLCDAKVDCPHADDEQPSVCHFKQNNAGEAKDRNKFSGTGFMFQIRNIKVRRSKLYMFDQDSKNKYHQAQQQRQR